MPLSFACPHCGLETLVDDEFAGHTGPCAGCGKSITVPFNRATSAPGAKSIARHTPKPYAIVVLVLLSIVAASIVFTLLFTLIFPSFYMVRDMLHASQCRSNLVRIAQALRQYEI